MNPKSHRRLGVEQGLDPSSLVPELQLITWAQNRFLFVCFHWRQEVLLMPMGVGEAPRSQEGLGGLSHSGDA